MTRMAKSRVLLIEDEPHILLSLEFLLERAGYETASAADGDEGLALAGKLRPDVVLLDIMLSAKGHEVEVLKGLELGASAYVTKPFGNVEILEAIRAVLEPRA